MTFMILSARNKTNNPYCQFPNSLLQYSNCVKGYTAAHCSSCNGYLTTLNINYLASLKIFIYYTQAIRLCQRHTFLVPRFFIMR